MLLGIKPGSPARPTSTFEPTIQLSLSLFFNQTKQTKKQARDDFYHHLVEALLWPIRKLTSILLPHKLLSLTGLQTQGGLDGVRDFPGRTFERRRPLASASCTFQYSIRSNGASQRREQNSLFEYNPSLDQSILSSACMAIWSIGDAYISGWRSDLIDLCVPFAKPAST